MARRLAAIVAVDVVGWSRLMATDEDETWAAWSDLRSRIDPILVSSGGRIVKSTGDGLLVESSSVIEAVSAALAVQEETETWNQVRPPDRSLRLRIGVNVGDVIVADDGDVYGDGVNVAARLEALAEPGGVCLSDAAYQQVRGRIEARFVDRGEQWVKNIPTPVRVWAALGGEESGAEVDIGVAGLDHAEVVGRGGNATVYRAYQATMDRWVAVKVLDGSDETTRRRFDRERQAMGRLSQHPGIVTIYESGYTITGRPYLVMPYLGSGSLQDRIDRAGSMEWKEAAALISEVTKAVDHAHRAGIVHRDLKPGNVMLDEEGRPLVADFGIARLADQSQTVTEYLALTPAYSPPELLDGAEPTAAGDIYALAATFCALVSGTPPFVTGSPDADTLLALSRRIATDPPPDLRPFGVPEGISSAVERAMDKDPTQRPTTASEFGSMVAGGPTKPSVTVGERPSRQPADERTVGWRRYAPAGIAVLAVVLVGVGIAAFGGGEPSDATTTTDVPPETTTTLNAETTTSMVEDDDFEWSVELAGGISSVAVRGDRVFVLGDDGTLDAFDVRTGARLWDEPFDAGFGSAGGALTRSPVDLVTTDSRVYFVRPGSKLIYAIDAVDGTQDWRTLSPFDAAQDEPVIDEADGRIYVGFGQGVAALESSSASSWEEPTITRGLVDAISADGRLLVVGDGRSVYGINAETGESLWEIGPPQIDRPSWVLAQEVELESGGGRSFNRRVLVVTEGGDLVMLDGESGSVLWPPAPVSFRPGSPPEDVVYAAGVDREVVALDAGTGEEVGLWSNRQVVFVDGPPIYDGISVYGLAGSEIVAINPRSGNERGRVELPSAPTSGLHVSAGLVIVALEDRLVAVMPAG